MVDDFNRDFQTGSAGGTPQLDAPTFSSGVLEMDHVFAALGHPRRRYLCYSLLEDAEWTLSELATKVAAWEDGVPHDEVDSHQQQRVYISLYHTHIPKLVTNGVLDFGPDDETITPAENTEQVLTALQGLGASLDSRQETHARGELNEG